MVGATCESGQLSSASIVADFPLEKFDAIKLKHFFVLTCQNGDDCDE